MCKLFTGSNCTLVRWLQPCAYGHVHYTEAVLPVLATKFYWHNELMDFPKKTNTVRFQLDDSIRSLLISFIDFLSDCSFICRVRSWFVWHSLPHSSCYLAAQLLHFLPYAPCLNLKKTFEHSSKKEPLLRCDIQHPPLRWWCNICGLWVDLPPKYFTI